MKQIYYHICFELRRSRGVIVVCLLLVLSVQVILPVLTAGRVEQWNIDGSIEHLMVEFHPMIGSPLWIGCLYLFLAAGLLVPIYLVYAERMPHKTIYARMTLPIPRTQLYLAKYLAGVLCSWFVYAIEILAAFSLFGVYCLTTPGEYTVTMGLFRAMIQHPVLQAVFPLQGSRILMNLLVLALLSGVILTVSILLSQHKKEFVPIGIWMLSTVLLLIYARRSVVFVPFVQNQIGVHEKPSLLYDMGIVLFLLLSLFCMERGWRSYMRCEK